MPKRSNDFQKLIYLIRHALAGDARVTESALLRDRITGKRREVDVRIHGLVGGLPATICIECRDRKRVADVGWVEEMKAKHERLPTNMLILASRNGFTMEAERVARTYGIVTQTVQSIEATDFPALLRSNDSLGTKTFALSPERVVGVAVADGRI
jgi:hypothetical protein